MAEVKLEDVPRKVRDLYNKAFAAYERGNWDYAMDMFMTSLELEPGLLKARTMLRAASFKKTQAQSGIASSLAGLQGMGTLLKLKATLNKNPGNALQLAEKLLRIAPLNKTFLLAYEEAARAADQPEAAIISFEAARDRFSGDLDFLQHLGKLYMDTENTSKGREVYEQIVNMNPKDQHALKQLKDAAALDTMQTGGWVGAKSYRDVIKDKKEATLLEQENRAVQAGDSAESLIKNTLAKIQREPDNLNFRRALADLYMKQHHYAEAIAALEEAKTLSGNADPQIERTISTAREKQMEQTVKSLREKGQNEEADAKALELEQFRVDEAAARVKQYPNDLLYKFEYGQILFQHDFFNEAAQQFQQSQRNPQKRVESLFYLGRCFRAKGQIDIAVEQLQTAVSELPSMDTLKKEILYELGVMYEQSNRTEEARKVFKTIYSVDIGYRDVASRVEGS